VPSTIVRIRTIDAYVAGERDRRARYLRLPTRLRAQVEREAGKTAGAGPACG
jgi:hypothetical protein